MDDSDCVNGRRCSLGVSGGPPFHPYARNRLHSTVTTLASTALMLRGSDILVAIEVKNPVRPEPIKNEEPVIGPLTP